MFHFLSIQVLQFQPPWKSNSLLATANYAHVNLCSPQVMLPPCGESQVEMNQAMTNRKLFSSFLTIISIGITLTIPWNRNVLHHTWRMGKKGCKHYKPCKVGVICHIPLPSTQVPGHGLLPDDDLGLILIPFENWWQWHPSGWNPHVLIHIEEK